MKLNFRGFFGSDMSKSSELAWYVERSGISREKSKSLPISTRNPWPPLPWSVRKSNSSSRIANRFWKKNNFCFDFCDILIVFSISSGFPSDLGRVGDPENSTKIKQISPRSSKIVDFRFWFKNNFSPWLLGVRRWNLNPIRISDNTFAFWSFLAFIFHGRFQESSALRRRESLNKYWKIGKVTKKHGKNEHFEIFYISNLLRDLDLEGT